MKIKHFIPVVFACLFLFTACGNENDMQMPDNFFIKKIISSDGRIVTNFVYDAHHNLIETQGYFTCSKFTYNDGKLMRVETAVDPDLLSSTAAKFDQNSKLMTAENSVFTSHSDYQYSSDGKLEMIKNYVHINGKFVYRSKQEPEYTGDRITKLYLYNDKNEMTQFTTYEYDDLGNVTTEKDYSLLNADRKAEFLRETIFKYDNKNNPFLIYKKMANPGLYSNYNNIIETKTITHMDVPNFPKTTLSNTIYEYNSFGFPIKESSGSYYYIY